MSADGGDDNTSKRRSSRLVKRRRFDDELVQCGPEAAPGPSSSKTQPARTRPSTSSGIPETVISSSSTSTTQPQKVRVNKLPTSSSTSNKFACTPSTSTVLSTNKNTSKKQKNLNKDLGRWKPADDFMLMHNVLQTNDLSLVHKGVKFSCRFTLKEIEQRWSALLYDPTISKLAVSAINNLPLEVIAHLESKVLFSSAEEELLATIPSKSVPTIETFQELLSDNLNIFYRGRSVKTLMNHWQMMKRYSLLPDQRNALETPILPCMRSLEDRNIHILNNEQEVTTIIQEHIPTFAECEESLNDQSILNKEIDPLLIQFLSLENNKVNEEIKILESQLPKAQDLVFPATGINPIEFDSDTLAVLRGRVVRYFMRSKEITIGRSSKYQQVDIDLKIEGPALNISRRQGTIRLHDSGDFSITCEGKKCFYVNGNPITAGNISRLNHNSVIEIAGLKFIFIINEKLIKTLRQMPSQEQQKQPCNQKSQTATVTKSEESVLSVPQQQQKQDRLKKQQKLDGQQKNILEKQNQKLSQQQQLDQVINKLLSEEEEHYQ